MHSCRCEELFSHPPIMHSALLISSSPFFLVSCSDCSTVAAASWCQNLVTCSCLNPVLNKLAELHVIEGVPSLIFGTSSYTIEVTSSPSHVNLLCEKPLRYSNHVINTPPRFSPYSLLAQYISQSFKSLLPNTRTFLVCLCRFFFPSCFELFKAAVRIQDSGFSHWNREQFPHQCLLLIPRIECVYNVCRQWRRSASLLTTWRTSSRPMGAQPPLSVRSVVTQLRPEFCS